MTIHHHITSSGLFLLVTCLVLSTRAIQVETLPPVPCHEFRPAVDVLVAVESSCSNDKIGGPDEGGANSPVTSDTDASAVVCPSVQPKVGDCCSPLSVCNEIGRKYHNGKECVCSDGQFHCTFNECALPAYPATQQGSAPIVNQRNLTEANEDDDAVPPRPVLNEVKRHGRRRRKRDKGEKRRNAKKNGGVMRSSNSRKLLPDIGWRGLVSSKAVADGINVSCVMNYAQGARYQGTLS